jgi:hypothetical protein
LSAAKVTSSSPASKAQRAASVFDDARCRPALSRRTSTPSTEPPWRGGAALLTCLMPVSTPHRAASVAETPRPSGPPATAPVEPTLAPRPTSRPGGPLRPPRARPSLPPPPCRSPPGRLPPAR